MKTWKHLIFGTTATWSLLPVRIGLGLVMTGHGAQKLFGWFEGPGLTGTGTYFAENLGLVPGLFWASLAAGGEFFGGLLVLLGLATRPAALVLTVTMVVAAVTAHGGAFFLPEGMEFCLTLGLMGVALMIGGAGNLSLDQTLFKKQAPTL